MLGYINEQQQIEICSIESTDPLGIIHLVPTQNFPKSGHLDL